MQNIFDMDYEIAINFHRIEIKSCTNLNTYNFNIVHAHRHEYNVEWQKPKN